MPVVGGAEGVELSSAMTSALAAVENEIQLKLKLLSLVDLS